MLALGDALDVRRMVHVLQLRSPFCFFLFFFAFFASSIEASMEGFVDVVRPCVVSVV